MFFNFPAHALSPYEEDGATEIQCFEGTKQLLPFAVSAIYVREFVDRASIAQARTLIDSIYFNFEKIIENVDWMDPESHEATLDKVHRYDSRAYSRPRPRSSRTLLVCQ